jgi:hypothetical protein
MMTRWTRDRLLLIVLLFVIGDGAALATPTDLIAGGCVAGEPDGCVRGQSEQVTLAFAAGGPHADGGGTLNGGERPQPAGLLGGDAAAMRFRLASLMDARTPWLGYPPDASRQAASAVAGIDDAGHWRDWRGFAAVAAAAQAVPHRLEVVAVDESHRILPEAPEALLELTAVPVGVLVALTGLVLLAMLRGAVARS